MDNSQQDMKFKHRFSIQCSNPVFFSLEKTEVGHLSRTALPAGHHQVEGDHVVGSDYVIQSPNQIPFLATLKEKEGQNTGLIEGNVRMPPNQSSPISTKLNLNGSGPSGLSLRNAQLGAVHSLLAHWSLSRGVATIVLPTGTGKTETMLVASLADKADRTLVIVPSVDLKNQIASKYATWGMLRELGIIPSTLPNPKVLVLNKTVSQVHQKKMLEQANVVVSTPGLLARAPESVKSVVKDIFSHVFFDEAHHMGATEWSGLRETFSASKIVQFTATPYRRDRKPIEGKIIYNYPVSQALEDKCFSRISLVTVEERHPAKKDKAIADTAMARLMIDRNNGYTQHRMVVRAGSSKSAEELFHLYKKWFPKERIVLVHSRINGRKQLIEKIKADQFDIIVCVDMFKEGFDYPKFKIAAVHGIHKSLAVLLQFIGRFTRTQESLGEASFVVNFADEKMSMELA